MKTISERRRSSAEVKSGYDPDAADRHSQATQTRLHDLENQLVEAREAEQAIQLTFQVAMKAKQELLEAAGDEAREIIAEARREAMRLRDEAKTHKVHAEEQSERLVSEARRDALRLLTEGRYEAEELNTRLQSEHAETMQALEDAGAALEAAEIQFRAATDAASSRLSALKASIGDEREQLAESGPPILEAPPLSEPEMDTPQDTIVAVDDTTPSEMSEAEAVADQQGGTARQKDLLAALQSLGSLQEPAEQSKKAAYRMGEIWSGSPTNER